jgi:predicted transcriptional regulator
MIRRNETGATMTDGTAFTERELDIMSVLWREGSGTVAEVREGLAGQVVYTTVLKILQILEDKRMVRHEQQGRAYRYFPVVEPNDAAGHALGRIVDKIFHGSAELTLARLVSGRKLEPDEVARMKAMLDAARGEEDGS